MSQNKSNSLLFLLFSLIFSLMWPGTGAAAPPEGLYITEIMVNPPGEDQLEEWVEIANTTSAVIDLTGFAVGDEETVGQNEGMARFPAGTIIGAGQVLVIAQDAPTFARRYGFSPDFELKNGDAAVPDLIPAFDLAQGELGLANGGDELLLLDQNGELVDAVSYGDSDRFLRPPAPGVGRGVSLQRWPANCDSDSATDWRPGDPPNPGTILVEPNCGSALPATGIMPIGVVQGSGLESPFVGQTVTVRGIVIGVQADRNVSGVLFHTVYLQNSAADADGRPETSDGLPIFFATDRPTVRLGDEVEATGTVTEFFGLTELGHEGLVVQILSRGNRLPDPVELTLTADGVLPGEALEGMIVTLPDAVVLGGKFATAGGCGFAVTSAASGIQRIIRHSIETDIAAVVPVMHVDESACETMPDVKAGDEISGLAGPLTYNFDLFRIVNQAPGDLFVSPASLPTVPPPLLPGPGEISVTTVNVENLFDEIDDTGDEAEPKLSAEELDIKLQKIAHLIGVILGCPTVTGIQEVENRSLLERLADRLEPVCGYRYEIVHRESLDGRGIDVALLSDPRRVSIAAAELHPACTNLVTSRGQGPCPAGQSSLFSRPPLAVTTVIDGTTEIVFVVNHFKSKRGGEQETQPEREAQAAFVVELVDEFRARGHQEIVVLGDFNDYADSEPLRVLTTSGRLEHVLLRAPFDEQYSFNFSGVSQLIDGILLSSSLADRVRQLQFYHVNADFPDAWSTRLSSELIAFRGSDHDPAVVVLALGPVDPNAPLPTVAPAGTETTAPGSGESEGGAPTWLWIIVGVIFTFVGVVVLLIWVRFR